MSDLILYHDSPLCTSSFKSYSAEFAKCPGLPAGPGIPAITLISVGDSSFTVSIYEQEDFLLFTHPLKE